MKKVLFIGFAGLLGLASCSDDTYVGDQSALLGQSGNGEITFGLNVPATTRAILTGGSAAEKLHSNFIVWGEKGSAAETEAAGTPVFKNFLVKYEANSANKTLSNTKNWEYVGVTDDVLFQTAANVAPTIGNGTSWVGQEVKYWDYSANHYTFTALATNPSEITDGKVKLSKLTAGTTSGTDGKFEKGYTLTLAGADLDQLYLSDRVEIGHGTGTDRDAANAYGGNVTLTFRQPFAKVRVAFYETVPGYKVQILGFKTVSGTAQPTFADMKAVTAATTGYMANFPSKKLGANSTYTGTMTVKYRKDSEYLNQPDISVSTTESNVLTLGNAVFDTELGTLSSSATFDQSSKAYSYVMNKVDNTDQMLVCVTYKLISNDNSGEEITVNNACVAVPAQYMQWQNNHAYTYLFKISNNTNGTTGTGGTDPEGLYPITFDAVVVQTEDGLQETISTLTTPSITTYAASANTVDIDEYKKNGKIWATAINDSKAPVTLNTSGKESYFYQLDAIHSEDEVLAALKHYTTKDMSGTITGRNSVTLTKQETTINAAEEKPAEIDKSFAANTLASFTPSAAGYYAFVVVNTADANQVNHYISIVPTSDAVPTGTTHYTATAPALVTDATEVVAAGNTYFTYNETTKVYECHDLKVGDKAYGYYKLVTTSIVAIEGVHTFNAANIYLKKTYMTTTDGDYQVKVIKVVD